MTAVMRDRLRGFVLVFVLGGAVATSAAAEPVVGPPRLQIEQERLDLGEVPRGRTVEATFVVRNLGGETLQILEARPG
jgi:hypothetical protein